MNKSVFLRVMLGALALFIGQVAQAQLTYSNAVMALNPVAYWPLSESATQPSGGLIVATNSGSLGALGQGYYETWWQTNVASYTLTSTNSLGYVTGPLAGTGQDTAMQQGLVGQYVVIPRTTNGVANGTLTLTAPFSIEVWCLLTNNIPGQLKPIVGEGFNNIQNTNAGYVIQSQGTAIGVYATNFYFQTYNGAGTKSEIDTPAMPTNRWYHVVGTFDGTTMTLYTNGIAKGTLVPAVAGGANYVPDTVSPLIIGGGNELGISGGANSFFGSGIGQVAIYNTALTAAKVLADYQNGTNGPTVAGRAIPYSQLIVNNGATIYLRLDETNFPVAGAPSTYPVATNYGSTVAAANGNYLPGTTPGVAGPSYSGFGSPSYAVALNGFNAGIDVGGGSLPAVLNPTNNTPFTASAWFRGNPSDCVGRFQTIIGHGNTSWELNLDTSAGVEFNPGSGPALKFSGVAAELFNGMFVNDGRWHFIAGVCSNNNESLYIDGILALSGTSAVTVTNGNLNDVILGGDPSYLAPQPTPVAGGGQWFDGSIAQVAFFTNALSGAQIEGLYSTAGVAPSVRQQPLSESVTAGIAATDTVTVAGSLPITNTWYQNGSAVAGQTNSSLTFNPVVNGNAGSYYLIASNAYGAVTSATIQVTVTLPSSQVLFPANTYGHAVQQLNAAGYWPLNETAQPPTGQYIATNSGTLGAVGQGYYQSWYQPVSIATNYYINNVLITNFNTFYATNDIVHEAGAIGDQALSCSEVVGGQYVVIPRFTNGVANSAVTITAPFTIECWLKTTNIATSGTGSSSRAIICEGRSQNQGNAAHNYTNNIQGFNLGQYQNYFAFGLYSGNTVNNTGNQEIDVHNLAVNLWYHVAVTYDGTTETFYTNGVVAGTATQTAFTPDTVSPLLIGTGFTLGASTGAGEYGGGIAEVAIYNSALSQARVQAHYAANTAASYYSAVTSDSPIIYLQMNEPAFPASSYPSPSSYPVATNYGTIGAAANGVYQAGTAPGVAGPTYPGLGTNFAVAINGFYGGVDVGGGNIPAPLNPTGNQPQTIAAWFQGNPVDARYQEIASHGDASWRLAMNGNNANPSFADYDVEFNPGNGPQIGLSNNVTPYGSSFANEVTNNFLFNDGNWHLAVGVSDGTNASLYLDGVLAITNAGVGSLAGSGLDVIIGGSPSHMTPSVIAAPSIRDFDGQIAQVAYFTNALTGAQIQQLYSAAGVPLTIEQQPQSVTNNTGTAATLSINVRGSTPVYQWYSTNVNTSVVTPLASQTNASLVFNPVNLGNGGFYFVIATNSYNSVTSSVAQLTVFGPPVVLQQTPTNVQVFLGTAPTLQMTIAGPTPWAFQWSSNGVPLSGATNIAYNPSTLVLSTNVYSCVITNIYGSVTNSPITAAVIMDPTAPFPTQVLADGPVAYFRLDEASGTTAYDYAGANNATYTNVTLGEPGYTSINPVQSDPTETATEFGDYPPGNDYAGNVPSYLNFGTPNGSNAQFSVEAWITEYLYQSGNCIVALGYGGGGEQFNLDTGSGSAGDLRFFVRNAAGVESGASSSTLLKNDGLWHHVVGVCDEAGGHVYLYLDGNLLASNTITAGSGLLSSTIPLSIGARESANNSPVNYDYQFYGRIDDVAIYNKALSAAQVHAHFLQSGVPPLITSLQPSSSVTTNQNANVTLTITANGTLPLAYQWTDNNGNQIAWGTNATLTLTNVQPSQAGNYTVYVTNYYGGPVTTNANITVTQVPQIVQDIQPANATVYAGTPVTLSVTASGTPPLTYQWYQDGTLVPNATNTTYTFTALASTHTYYMTVSNVYSAGSPTTSSTATIVGMPSTFLTPGNYTDHLKITFAGYNRSETLSDFPILVRLSTSLSGFSYSHFAEPSGADLRFTDSSGTRIIPHEIDEWNPAGASTVWVQMPALSGTNNYIWAYWGNPTPDTALPSTDVWVPQPWEGLPAFDVVYHLKESTFPFVDSSGQYPSLTGAAPTPTPGIVGTGENFGATSFLDAGIIDVSNAFTLSAWVNIATNASNIQAIWASKAGSSSNGFAFYVNTYSATGADDQKLLFETSDHASTPTYATTVPCVSSNQWHQVVASINRAGGTAQLYVDGVFFAATGSVLTDFNTNQDIYLGEYQGNSFPLNGLMDEARIQSSTNDANWVWASYMTVAQNASFENYSTVVSTATAPTPVIINVQTSGTSLTLSGTNGTPNATYYLLGTTNLTLPMSQWTLLSTTNFDGSGNFNISMPVNTTNQAEFIRIKE